VPDTRRAAPPTSEELPDIVLLDVTMPGGGIEAAARIAAACPASRIVMLTVSEDEDSLLAAMKAGAKATCSRASPPAS
jgi:DNA-binding NarL/FixJ family response regulator